MNQKTVTNKVEEDDPAVYWVTFTLVMVFVIIPAILSCILGAGGDIF